MQDYNNSRVHEPCAAWIFLGSMNQASSQETSAVHTVSLLSNRLQVGSTNESVPFCVFFVEQLKLQREESREQMRVMQ